MDHSQISSYYKQKFEWGWVSVFSALLCYCDLDSTGKGLFGDKFETWLFSITREKNEDGIPITLSVYKPTGFRMIWMSGEQEMLLSKKIRLETFKWYIYRCLESLSHRFKEPRETEIWPDLMW